MLDRVRTLLLIALSGLGVLLVALLLLGAVVLPAVRPLPYPEAAGTPLVLQRGTGTGASGSLVLPGDAVRFAAACGSGSRAEVEGAGSMETACSPEAGGGIVLSRVAPGRHRWRLTVTPSSRWSMVLSAPVEDGDTAH